MIPPKRMTVGVDFSESSRTALGLAARFAVHAGGELNVVHVQDPTLAAAARQARVDLGAESAEELHRFVLSTPPADALNAERFVMCGNAGKVLCDIAAREQSDILVVGAHGMTGAARWLFGSNTERVLRHAQMSVLVVPSEWRPARPASRDLSGLGPIIAAVDFSEAAFSAAYAAAHLARFFQTPLTVLHVVPELRVPDRWLLHANGAVVEAARQARAELDLHLARLKEIAPLHLHVVTGDVVGSILRAAEPQNAYSPLLVLGRRPQEADEGAPGTVVSRALASLRVPMLVVHPLEAVGRR